MLVGLLLGIAEIELIITTKNARDEHNARLYPSIDKIYGCTMYIRLWHINKTHPINFITIDGEAFNQTSVQRFTRNKPKIHSMFRWFNVYPHISSCDFNGYKIIKFEVGKDDRFDWKCNFVYIDWIGKRGKLDFPYYYHSASRQVAYVASFVHCASIWIIEKLCIELAGRNLHTHIWNSREYFITEPKALSTQQLRQ